MIGLISEVITLFQQTKAMIKQAQEKNYASFVKALLSVEYQIHDERQLDELYIRFMRQDGMTLLNDAFDEWVNEKKS